MCLEGNIHAVFFGTVKATWFHCSHKKRSLLVLFLPLSHFRRAERNNNNAMFWVG